MATPTTRRAPAKPEADRGPRTRTLTALALCGLLFAGLIAAYVSALPPTVQVQLDPQAIRPDALSQVVDPDPVAPPAPVNNPAVDLLMLHLKANPDAREWNDLHRAGTNTDLGVLNTAIDQMARAEKTPPNRFRDLPEGDQRTRLQAALGEQPKPSARTARTNAEIATAVGEAVNPGPPPPPNWWRRQVAPMFGLSLRDRQQWEDAVAKAVQDQKPQIQALYRKYQTARSVPDRVLVTLGDEHYQAVPARDAGGGAVGVVWNQNRAAVDCELSVRSKGKSTVYTRGTGVRLLSVPVVAGGDAGGPKLSWPPAACAVDEESFRTFLRGAGFPAKLTPREIAVQSSGADADPKFRITFRTESDDFPGWSQAGSLQLAGKPLTEQAAAEGQAALQSLRTFAPAATKIGSNAAVVKRLPGGELAATVTPAGGPLVTMRCAIDSTGGLVWTGPDKLKDAEALVDWVVTQQPKLKAARADLRLGEVRVDADGRLAGDLVLPPTAAVGQESSVPFSVSPSAVVFELPKKWEAPPESARAPEVWSKEQARKAILEEVQSAYPNIAPQVEVEAAGDKWVIGLRVGDWPLLRVGPFAANNPTEGRKAVHEALSEPSVKKAAERQWRPADPTAKKSTIPHPKYGEVAAQIESWKPVEGKVSIANQVILWEAVGKKLPLLEWTETGTCTAADGWEFDDPVAEMAERYAKEHLLTPLRQAALDSTGGKFDFEPDPLPNGRWLTLAPVSVRLKARMQIPIPCDFDAGVRLEAKGVVLDRTGLHFVEQMKATLEGFTLSIPEVGIALSDPYVSFHNTPKGTEYSLGALITPPLTPVITGGMFPNPWTYLFCLKAQASIRFREPEIKLDGMALLLRRLNNDAAFGTANLAWTIPTDTQPGVITGSLMASGTQANVRFQFGGSARFDSTGVSAKGVLELPKIGRTDAWLTLTQSADKKARADITAVGRMAGQRLDLKGHMTVDLDKLKSDPNDPLAAVDYRLKGEVKLPGCVLHALVTPKDGVKTWVEAKVGDLTIQKLFTLSGWGNGDADREAIRREVEAITKEVRERPYRKVREEEEKYLPPPPLPPVTPTPNRVVVKTPPPPPPPRGGGGKGNGDDPSKVLTFDRVAPGGLIPVDEPYGENPPTIVCKYYTDEKQLERAAKGEAQGNPKDGLILNKKDLGLEHLGRVGGGFIPDKGFEVLADSYKCNFVLWPRRDGSGRVVDGSLLVVDHIRKRIRLLTSKSRYVEQGTYQEADLTETFKGMTPLFWKPGFSDAEKKAFSYNQMLATAYAESVVSGFKPDEAPQKVLGGNGSFKFVTTQPNANRPTLRHTALVRPDDRLEALILNVDGSAIPPEGHTTELLRRLSVMKADADLDDAWVVAAEAGSAGRVAFVHSTLTGQTRNYTFRLTAADKPVPITDLRGENPHRTAVNAAAGRLAGVLWEAKETAKAVFVGPRGVLATTADGFWVVPDGSSGGEKRRGWYVPWKTFREWPKEDTAARLPVGWRSLADRTALTPDVLADAVLADWEADRTADIARLPKERQEWARWRRATAEGWTADPLGMILGLAEFK